jgi:hypothetical protein
MLPVLSKAATYFEASAVWIKSNDRRCESSNFTALELGSLQKDKITRLIELTKEMFVDLEMLEIASNA